MRLQVYKEIRNQLANYINGKIYDEWVNIGKTKIIIEWYKKALLDNKEVLYKMFSDYEYDIKNEIKKPVGMNWVF